MGVSTKEHKVYVHLNNANKKVYVGITCKDSLEKRWGKNGAYYKGRNRFWSAIMHYGWDNFQHILVADKLTRKEAENFEKLLIKKLKARDYKYGYNILKGGYSNGGMDGLTHSKETKEKMSKAAIGRKFSEEHKKKLSEARRKYLANLTEEEKEQLREQSRLNQKFRYEDPEERRKTAEKTKISWENPSRRKKVRANNEC